MLQIMVAKLTKGTAVTVSSDNFEDAKRAYRQILKASLKVDQCTKTTWQGQTSNGMYAYELRVPGLPYVVACERIARLWPDGGNTRYPQSLIGG